MIETASIRLARPCRDLAAAERFYVAGLGLDVLFRGETHGPGEHDILMLERLEAAGGTRVGQGPYWDRWGVSVRDPDGYRLVLTRREWSNAD
jgi:hypothetical protein